MLEEMREKSFEVTLSKLPKADRTQAEKAMKEVLRDIHVLENGLRRLKGALS